MRNGPVNDVGILIAGLLYIDDPAKTVHYLFFSDAKGGEATYFLPYLWKAPQRPDRDPADRPLAQKSRLVDLFFVVTRDEQSPFERNGTPWSTEKGSVDYFSEFALHVPRQLTEPDYPVLDGREARFRDVYGFHYVPYGEMVFFTYAWRLLFRAVVGSVDARERSSAPVADWHGWEWEAWRKGRFRERSIEAAIQKAILANKNGLWEGASKAFLSTPNEDVEAGRPLSDWVSLRLIKRADETFQLGAAVGPLLTYLDALSTRHVALARLTDEVRELRKEHVRCVASNGSLFADDFVKRLDRILRRCVASVPWTEDVDPTEPRDPREQLLLLHRAARLPIVPYFYWNTLLVQAEASSEGHPSDEEQLRVTHLVLPTWTTVSKDQMFKAPYWRLPRTAAELLAYSNVDCAAECRHVGFAVVGLRPWPELDWTITTREGKDFERGASRKARRIFRLIERFSMPQIDAAFFGQIRKEALQAAGKQEGVAELLWTFGHDAQRPARTVGLLLESEVTKTARVAGFLARSLENRLGAYPVIFAVTETAEQKENHLLEDIRSAQGWRWLKSIWQEAVVDSLLRVLVDPHPLWGNLRHRWLGKDAPSLKERCLDHLDPLADPTVVSRAAIDGALDAIIAVFGDRLQCSCTESVRVPAILENRVGKTQARAELALLMLLAEIVTNAFKHSFVDFRPGQIPSFSLSADSVESRANLHIRIGPSHPPRTDFKDNHDMKAVGLRSLRLLAEVLGGAIATKPLTLLGGRSEDLPFPAYEDGCLHWTVTGVLIRPEDFTNE